MKALGLCGMSRIIFFCVCGLSGECLVMCGMRRIKFFVYVDKVKMVWFCVE